MAVKFFNIRSKEVRVADTEPLISAMWASSDRSPNITQGQDFGWRLAPEVVVELKQIKQDYSMLERIAIRYNVTISDVDEKLILQYISDKTTAANAPLAQEEDYSDDYDAEIRRLELQHKLANQPVTTTSTTEEPVTTTTSTTQAPSTAKGTKITIK